MNENAFVYWFDIVNSLVFPGYKLIIFSLKLELLKIVLNTDLLCHNEQSFMFYVSKTKGRVLFNTEHN